jgi:hypothetical protein
MQQRSTRSSDDVIDFVKKINDGDENGTYDDEDDDDDDDDEEEEEELEMTIDGAQSDGFRRSISLVVAHRRRQVSLPKQH